MKLTDYDVMKFSEVLASEAPAPGGGSAAALSGAMGVSLCAMVASLTVGKAKYAEHEELNKEVLQGANELRVKLLDAINRDTEIFGQMSDAFKMPKATDEEKDARKEAIEKASKACTYVPYEIMELCKKSLELTSKIVGKSNKSAASDLGVAALNLKAGIQAAWLNVLINIGGIKDQEFANEHRNKGEELLKTALPLADDIYEKIKQSL